MACLATGWSILSAGNAQAFNVTWNGTNYDVTTFTGDYASNISKFATPSNGGQMPWWGSAADTWSFMQATAGNTTDLYTNLGVNPTTNTIIFGYDVQTFSMMGTSMTQWTGKEYSDGAFGSSGGSDTDTAYGSKSISWAQATEVTAVPGPLPILGIGAALGFSRKLKKRIANRKLSTTD
jgi:hypothetical protein